MEKNIVVHQKYYPEHGWFARIYSPSKRTEKRSMYIIKGVKIFWYGGVILAFLTGGVLITCAIVKAVFLFWGVWFLANLLGIGIHFLAEALWGLKIIDPTIGSSSKVGQLTFETVEEKYYSVVEQGRDIRFLGLLMVMGIMSLIMSLSEIFDFMGKELD